LTRFCFFFFLFFLFFFFFFFFMKIFLLWKMAHQSGIPISATLRDAFADARSEDSVRTIKVAIVGEKMVPASKQAKQSSESSDFDALQKLVEPRQPCYLLFKLDENSSESSGSQQWVFVVYAPDDSPIKDRMLYASSRDTCKKSLGYSYFSQDYHVTEPQEIAWSEFQSHKQGKYSEAPLTVAEQETRAERHAEVHVGHTKEYVHSVKFPISSEARDALARLDKASVDAVFLRVDVDRETVELRGAQKATIASLPDAVPDDSPCFVVFRYAHSHGGRSQAPYVFVYSCPTNAPIKLKMLHSTVKSTAIAGVEAAGIKVEKKVEISERDELTAELLDETLHPPGRTPTTRTAFSRPTPAGRRARRAPARK
jgi:twinfilin